VSVTARKQNVNKIVWCYLFESWLNADCAVAVVGKGRDGDTVSRQHCKGCNCKRSGCLKNYCECYEVWLSFVVNM